MGKSRWGRIASRTSRRGRVAVMAVLAGATIAAAVAPAVLATTEPSPYLTMKVWLTDQKVELSRNRVAGVTYVLFYVMNKGKQDHELRIVDQHTKVLKPGERTQFAVAFPDPGPYKLTSTGHPTPKPGILHVTFPVRPD